MSSNSNNTDFLSQLLRMNGSLQASITELRYHCAVYRLSLKSICKVLASVQKDQDARLRCLATSRPSFQAYLLNLSQKQALGRIKNVVRKASTFINGYSLVDKRLFLPPPPKPSAARRCGNENKTAADVTSNTRLTDGTGAEWVSKSCLVGPGSGTAAVIIPVIAQETTANKGQGNAEVATTKNNDDKEERKHRYSDTRRRRSKEEKKKTSERRSKSNNRTRIKSSHKHSSSSSTCVGRDSKKKGSCSSSAEGSEERRNRGAKRNSSEKIRSRSSSKNCLSGPADSTKNKHRITKEDVLERQIRPKSITSRNHHHGKHHHHRRHKVINFRTLTIQHDDEELEEDNEIAGVSFIAGKSNKEYEQPGSLMRQSGNPGNRIPPLLSIATSSAMKINKSSGSMHINENLRMEARRVQRPSKEKQYEGRRTNNNRNRENSLTNDTKTKTVSSSNRNTRNIWSIRRREVHETNTVTTARPRGTSTPTTRRCWGGASTTTATTKAGYKVRESLAVIRNRNYGNTCQGQGIVARKHVFSSQKPGNNFKLNPSFTTASSALVIEKVRRVQLNGSGRQTKNSFFGRGILNGGKPYETTRKCMNGSGNGNNA